ncbi:hypothetical protein ACSYAD_06560 [Acaryochloris marina NIES-2412]|uniref:hypothetical protein n=1 Tax=Acaryochloris marina TaxID=155978 RepID=UPI00405991D4
MLSHITDWLEQVLIGFSRATCYVFYLVPFRLQKFRKQYPNVQILASGVTKARKMKADSPVQYELEWVTSRRGMLILTESYLFCGDWEIPLDTVSEAVLLSLTGGYVLKISTTAGDHYQFGLNKNLAWETQSVLSLTKQQGSIAYSTQSLILRAIMLMAVLWYLYQGSLTASLAKILLALIASALIGIPLLLRIFQKFQQNR